MSLILLLQDAAAEGSRLQQQLQAQGDKVSSLEEALAATTQALDRALEVRLTLLVLVIDA